MMNLQLNPAQALALYEMIVSIMTSSSDLETNTRLEEVKQKLKISILDALQVSYSSSNKNKFSSWLDKEQEKIMQLNADLAELRVTTNKEPSASSPSKKRKSKSKSK